MISSILKREFSDTKSTINIVWTKTDDTRFKNFIEKSCDPCFLIDFDQTYYGLYDPSVIICNHRLVYLEKCIMLSKYFHCPVLIIDHEHKPNIVSNKIDTSFEISPVIQVAISHDIYLSWNKIHDYIMDYNNNTQSAWKNLIYNICKEKFKITEINRVKDNEK